VAALVGADSDEIVFTSGGTEANNLAIKGLAFRRFPVEKGHLVISAFEHLAVVEPARFLERLGYTLSIVPTNKQGVVNPRQVAAAMRPDTLLVSIMHANNEIGTVQPIREIAAVCRKERAAAH
jgi:cysteine desulfurase